MTTLALLAAAMYLGYRMFDRTQNPGYVCPQCGTREQGRHGKDCSWG